MKLIEQSTVIFQCLFLSELYCHNRLSLWYCYQSVCDEVYCR